MRENKLKSSILAGLCGLAIAFPVWKNGDLTDITKPYIGEYECKQAQLGDYDYLKKFDYISLELKNRNQFLFVCKEKGGKKHTINGEYEYDKKKETFIFKTKEHGEIHREIPFKNGELSISLSFGVKTLTLKFQQKN